MNGQRGSGDLAKGVRSKSLGVAGVISLALISSGCFSMGQQLGIALTDAHPPESADLHTREMNLVRNLAVSTDDAQAMSKRAFRTIGYKVSSTGTDPIFVRSETRTVAVPKFCDCGLFGRRVISGDANSTLVVSISQGQSEPTSEVRVENACSANLAAKNQTIQCASRGLIELDFLEALEGQINDDR